MDYRLEDLIDIPLFQTLQDKLNEVYSFPSAIIDNEGKVLTATAWQDVCTKFHRTHPECATACRASDLYILDHIHEARPAVTYKCPHGLVDNATPIVIGGRHLGNYFTGQFFLEPPDLEAFRARAVRYGFDQEAYLEAVRKVPVWSQQKLDQYLDFIKGFTEILAGIGYKNLQEQEARKVIAQQASALEDTHLFNQQVIDGLQEGLIVYDRDLRYRVWNPAMEKISGFRAEDVLGRWPHEVFPFLAQARIEERVRAALNGTVAETIDFPHQLPSGRTGWSANTCGPLYGKDGAIVGCIATVHDVTDRKRAEMARAESEARFRRLVALAPLPLVFGEVNGESFYINDRFTKVFGYSSDDVPSQSAWWALAYPDEAYRAWVIDTFTRAVEKAAATSTDIEPIEYSVTCKDGTLKVVEISGITFDNWVLATMHDVTEQRNTEAALLTVQKLESLGTLAGGIAHDFNNVLTGILGSLSLLKEGGRLDQGQAGLINEAMDACMTARGLARQLLTFAAGGQPTMSATDIGPVVRDAAAFAARGSTVRCVVDIGEAPLPALADKDQLAQVVQNLVLNAVQAMPRGGTITIQARACELRDGEVPTLAGGRYVRFSVRDEGRGVPAGYRAKIFDPFFTTKADGRGLGLAMCHSIITKHGGHIGLEPTAGTGSTFTVHLPALDAFAAAAGGGDQAAPVSGSGRVLVMDDDVSVARVLRRMLERVGYEVEVCADGASALAAYDRAKDRGTPFDAVVMDLTIPAGMGGKETMERLLERNPDVRAVVTSGYSTDPIMSEWDRFGFAGALAKPFRVEDVSRVVHDAVAVARAAREGR